MSGGALGPLLAFDRFWFGLERRLAALILSAMGGIVFLDVVQRVGSREGSLLADRRVVVPAIVVLSVLGARTRLGTAGTTWGVAVGLGVVVARELFLRLFPNGLVWSQTFALSVTLWLGILGASLAAHERRHLALDVGSKLWPPHVAPKMAALGHVVTAGFCLLLLVLGWRSVTAHIDLWTSSSGAAGNLSGLAIPKWVPALAIPYGGVVLSLRFLLEAVRTWTGELQVGGDDTLHQLGIKDEEAGR